MKRQQATAKSRPEKTAAEKAEYIRCLTDGIRVGVERHLPDFGLFPEVYSTNEDDKDDNKRDIALQQIYQEIFPIARQAVTEGNMQKLQACFGPALYSLRQRKNRNIHQLRWKWIHAQEKIDAYTQLFKLVLSYGRVMACEEYMACAGDTINNHIQAHEGEIEHIRLLAAGNRGGDEWVPLGNNMGYVRRPKIERLYRGIDNRNVPLQNIVTFQEARLQDQIATLRAQLVSLENTLVQYTAWKKTQIKPIDPLAKKLQDITQKLEAMYSPDMLTLMHQKVTKNTYALLTTAQAQTLKEGMHQCLRFLTENRGGYIASLVKQTFKPDIAIDPADAGVVEVETRVLAPYSAKTVLTVVPLMTYQLVCSTTRQHAYKDPEIQNDIAKYINQLFASEQDVANILHQLQRAIDAEQEKAQVIEEEYRYLVNDHRRTTQEQELIAEYELLAEPFEAFKKSESVEDLYHLDYDDQESSTAIQPKKPTLAEKIIANQIGEIALNYFQLYASRDFSEKNAFAQYLFTMALERYHQPLIDQAEKERRLAMLIYLIQRGCPIFLLSMFVEKTEDPQRIVSTNQIPWSLLIAALRDLVCITPVAEKIYEVVLAYAEKYQKRSEGRIAVHRRQAIIRLTKLLYENQQQTKILDEASLLKIVKKQIKESPRGWLGRSQLYKELQKVMDQIQGKQLMALQEEEKDNELTATIRRSAFRSEVRASTSSSVFQPVSRMGAAAATGDSESDEDEVDTGATANTSGIMEANQRAPLTPNPE